MVSVPDSTIVVLRTDYSARMGTVHEIHAILIELGLVRVVYAGRGGESLPLKLPVLKDAERLASMPEQNLAVIDLAGSGQITVRGSRVHKSNLSARVEDELNENEFVVFSIRPASDASYDDFLEVLAETKAGGATRIAIEKPM
jgi:biopolymer transport protein ExbD